MKGARRGRRSIGDLGSVVVVIVYFPHRYLDLHCMENKKNIGGRMKLISLAGVREKEDRRTSHLDESARPHLFPLFSFF